MLDIVFFLVIAFAVIVTLYPFLYVVSVSISDGQAVARGDVLLWPKGFSLDAFKMVVEYEQLWISYGNTLFYTVFGTIAKYGLYLPGCLSPEQKAFFSAQEAEFLCGFHHVLFLGD